MLDCQEQKGFALILTLWILGILSLLLLAFTKNIAVNVHSASHVKKELEFKARVKSLAERFAAELARPSKGLGQNAKLARIKGEVIGRWEINLEDGQRRKLKKDEEPKGNPNLVVTIASEDAKFPLQKAKRPQLEKLPRMNPVVAQQITQHLKSLPKGQSLTTTAELLNLQAVTPELYYGDEKHKGLKDMLTTYSRGKIYINHSSAAVLIAIPGVDRDLAKEFQERIDKEKFFLRTEDLQNVLGVTPDIYKLLKKWISLEPQYYRIEAKAVRGEEEIFAGGYLEHRPQPTRLDHPGRHMSVITTIRMDTPDPQSMSFEGSALPQNTPSLVEHATFPEKGVAIAGIALNDIQFKNLKLPLITKKEEKETAELQIKFQLEKELNEGHVLSRFKHGTRNSNLTLAGIRCKLDDYHGAYPLPLALMGLAFASESLGEDDRALLLLKGQKEYISLSVERREVVFMRNFPVDENLQRELRLSAQRVYGYDERSMLDLSRIICFGETDGDLESAAQKLGVNFTAVSANRFFSGSHKNENLLHAGLLALHQNRKLMGTWNFLQREEEWVTSLKKIAKLTLPLWPIFPLLYLYADTYYIETLERGLQGKMESLNHKYREVRELESEVTGLEDYMNASGRALSSPGRWLALMQLLEEKRPYGLKLTAFSGKIASTILINGRAGRVQQVSEYMERLNQTQKLHDLNLIFTQKRKEGDVDFQLSFLLEEKDAEDL